jgi:endonuclease/exonuclease/phosphatase family metal-dependent hydrolase
MDGVTRIVSWNIGRRSDVWRSLLDSGVDVGLLQEAQRPPPELERQIEIDSAPWNTAGYSRNRLWRSVVAKFSDRVQVRPRPLASTADARSNEQIAVSRQGTLAVADMTLPSTGEVITLASMYGAWERPVKSAGASWIYADASVHRLISDLSALIGRQRGHKIIAAGDLNVLYGYGEGGSQYWKARYETVFSRMEALGLPLVGPYAPEGGRSPDPWPAELPWNSTTVPTFRTAVARPETASRQLDFVFASNSLRDRLQVYALNAPEEWGPSDHCRILIELRE